MYFAFPLQIPFGNIQNGEDAMLTAAPNMQSKVNYSYTLIILSG